MGSQSAKFKRIGNAVPPPPAFRPGRVIREAATTLDRDTPSPGFADLPRNLVRSIKKRIGENRVNKESRTNRVGLRRVVSGS